MEILKTILNLVVFLLSICVLVCVHELGHMSMAKLFNVYCYEFSIGMGPVIYQKKPKKGSKQETIQRFKSRFGSQMVEGYLWKCPIRPFRYKLPNYIL